MNTEVFNIGDRVINEMGKKGTITGVRNDSHEKSQRISNPNHGYYYMVDYDDSSFNTYVSGHWMKRI